MDEPITRSLSDEDISTAMPGSASATEERPRDEDTTDKKDADGTDGDTTDMQDGDAKDADGTDGQDTDSKDTDGTDQPA
jgi:hypothetical protein